MSPVTFLVIAGLSVNHVNYLNVGSWLLQTIVLHLEDVEMSEKLL